MMPEPTDEPSAEETSLLDRVADLTLASDEALLELCEIYQDPRLSAPEVVFNAHRRLRKLNAS